jgi:hypothetical protein
MANTGINPRNAGEIKAMEIMTRCHDWLAAELGIDSNMDFGRTAYWGRDAFHAGFWRQSDKLSVLNFRNLYGNPMSRLLRIVAHEARHAVQYRDGMLEDSCRKTKTNGIHGRLENGIWNGQYYHGLYKDAPWEIDARAHEQQYAQLVIDAGVISQDELDFVLPGVQDQIVILEDETREAIRSDHGRVSWYKVAVQTKQESDAATEVFRNTVIDAGFVQKGKKWHYMGDDYKSARKIWEDAKKATRTTYRKDAIAFLTCAHEKSMKKSDRFWAAQENVVEFKSRPLQDSDLVF